MIERNRPGPRSQLGEHVQVHVVRDLRVVDEVVVLERARAEQVVDRGLLEVAAADAADRDEPRPSGQPTFQMSVRPVPPSTFVTRSRGPAAGEQGEVADADDGDDRQRATTTRRASGRRGRAPASIAKPSATRPPRENVTKRPGAQSIAARGREPKRSGERFRITTRTPARISPRPARRRARSGRRSCPLARATSYWPGSAGLMTAKTAEIVAPRHERRHQPDRVPALAHGREDDQEQQQRPAT